MPPKPRKPPPRHSDTRKRNLLIAVAGAVAVVAILIVVSVVVAGGDDSGTTPSAASSSALFAGIPQNGTELGAKNAPVTLHPVRRPPVPDLPELSGGRLLRDRRRSTSARAR